VLIRRPPSATAIASTLFGDVNPSGKLPFTIARNVSDYSANTYNGSITVNPVANFTEGVFIDYKHFDAQGIEPLFEFGFGKSYSRWAAFRLLSRLLHVAN